MRAIIVDDENHCITTLSWSLKEYCPIVEIVGTARNGEEGITLINSLKPDVIFLDIEMPILSGIDMLQKFDHFDFKVIFTTAYDQYAIKAIKLNALDYLLKPIDKDELKSAIDKLSIEHSIITKPQIDNLKEVTKTKLIDKIGLSMAGGIQFIQLGNLMRIEGEGNYCNFVLSDKKNVLVSKKLGDAEDILKDNELFFRAHKSHIINIKFVDQYIRGEGGEIIMMDGTSISLSRNKKDEFLELFSKL